MTGLSLSATSVIFNNLRQRVVPALLFTYLLICTLVILVIPILAYLWLDQSGANPFIQPAQELPFTPIVNGITQSTGGASPTSFLWSLYLVGIIYLLTGVWVLYLRRQDIAGRVFTLFASAASLTAAASFDLFTTRILTPIWIFAAALSGGALIHLAGIFPQLSAWLKRNQWLIYLVYLPAPFLACLALIPLDALSRRSVTGVAASAAFGLVLLGLLVFFCMVVYRRFNASSPTYREQSRWILLGYAVAFAPLIVWIGLSYLTDPLDFSFVLLAPLAAFPLTVGYAILHYRPRLMDALLIQAVAYAILAGLIVAAYALIVFGVSLLLGVRLPVNHPVVIGLMVLILVIAINPLRSWMQQRVDIAFNRRHSLYREQVQAFTRELTHTLEVVEILNTLRDYIQEALTPTRLHIFIYDPLSNQYTAAPAKDSSYSTDIRFSPNGPVLQTLTRQADPLYLRELEALPEGFQPERNRVALLGATLFVCMPGQERLVGWLAMGPHQSGEPYTPREIRFLESICDQAALAIERSQVITDLERRVREMAVLTRIAQGVNITPEFDDILELIYTQTNVAIPNVDFHIVLTNPSTETSYYAFYLDQDERISSRENIPIPAGTGLESLVIRSQRSIICDEYEHECRTRGVVPDKSGISAWMGVPLNAGAQTIGCISLADRDPTVVFTEQQCNLLQAIADQTAGAIVKARLLAETEVHARQLAVLNEVGRSLTSTLEIKSLLSQILHYASGILDSEAGSLLMLDESSGDLVFEVATGPVAENLIGQHLASGTGLVGQVVSSCQPFIANNVQEADQLFSQPDTQTGFTCRDMMAVPIVLKDRTIGVIEVINKRDGSPFTTSDQELLTTLSSQAAIAIENARLYTQTDQALSARLDEMSVMQRIDRELNTSLDVERTLRIALDWSVNQSRAEAGVIGFIERDEHTQHPGLRVIASRGIDLGEDANPDQKSAGDGIKGQMWIDSPLILRAIQDGQSRCVSLVSDGSSRMEPEETSEALPQSVLLDHGRTQAIIPIRRKSDVIGMLLLESMRRDSFSPEVLTFLSRLSDHAAIAISNALLYADLQAANIAKSEFVSLVSHELKTPMTSIRGYADLLAQGTVGQINEIQANFLNTIRSNVNRMATLVSDLADVSRIEAGRMHLEFEAVSIEEVVSEVVRSTQGQIDEKEHILEIGIPSALPRVWGDYNRLIQVMTNLVSNAIKYTPQNGQIRIESELAENDWDRDGAPQVVHVKVVDNGFGISAEDQEKIFQKFFRSADQNIRDLPGTGLGLNITRHLVEMQGGRIWFETESGQGSTFHFTVPVTEAS